MNQDEGRIRQERKLKVISLRARLIVGFHAIPSKSSGRVRMQGQATECMSPTTLGSGARSIRASHLESYKLKVIIKLIAYGQDMVMYTDETHSTDVACWYYFFKVISLLLHLARLVLDKVLDDTKC